MGNQPTTTVQAERLEFLIAPGVVFPNWSVVASDTVEQALMKGGLQCRAAGHPS